MAARYFAVHLPQGRSNPLWGKFYDVATERLGAIAPDFGGINNLVLLQFWRREEDLRHEFASKPGTKKLAAILEIEEITSASAQSAPHAGYAESLNNYYKAGL